jgi:hypothetical protein
MQIGIFVAPAIDERKVNFFPGDYLRAGIIFLDRESLLRENRPIFTGKLKTNIFKKIMYLQCLTIIAIVFELIYS